MTRSILKPVIFPSVLVWIVACGATHAASISLVYTGDNAYDDHGALIARVGDILAFDVIADFTDAPTIGGGFDVIFNPNALSFVQLDLNITCNDPDCQCGAWGGCDVLADRIESWSLASFTPIATVLNLGSVTFEFIGHDFSRPFLHTGPTAGIGGPFISGEDFVSIIPVTYNEILLAPVPLPAGAWLLLGALGALAGVGPKKMLL